MAGENAYLKGMEDQLKVISEKVRRAKVEAPQPEVEAKLEEVSQMFNDLRAEDPETFDAQRIAFETTFNELNQMVTDNSELAPREIKAQEDLTKRERVGGRG